MTQIARRRKEKSRFACSAQIGEQAKRFFTTNPETGGRT